jgi:hypothetical protein
MAVKSAKGRGGIERRKSERASARFSMRVDAGAAVGTEAIVTESQNISASGVYCHASHYLAPFSKIRLAIVLPNVPGRPPGQDLVKSEAIVVRCSQRAGDTSATPYELACMFAGLDRESRQRIEEFVTWRNLAAFRESLGLPARSERVARAIAADHGAARTSAKPAPKGKAKPVAKAKAAPKARKKAAAKPKPKSNAKASAKRKVAKSAPRKSAGRKVARKSAPARAGARKRTTARRSSR